MTHWRSWIKWQSVTKTILPQPTSLPGMMTISMAETTTNHFLIADTSGLISLLSPQDANHHQARQAFARLRQRPCTIIIPGDILTETINTINKRDTYQAAVDACAFLQHTGPFLITEATADIRQESLDRFQRFGNGSLSLTDWVVLAFADAFETKELFAFDQAMGRRGYTILPPEEEQEAA